MIEKIELGGVEYPITFSMLALYKFEKLTGKNSFSELQKGAEAMSAVLVSDLAWCMIYAACKQEKQKFDGDVEDIAMYLTGDKMAFVMQIIADSQAIAGKEPTEPQEGEEVKKK